MHEKYELSVVGDGIEGKKSKSRVEKVIVQFGS